MDSFIADISQIRLEGERGFRFEYGSSERSSTERRVQLVICPSNIPNSPFLSEGPEFRKSYLKVLGRLQRNMASVLLDTYPDRSWSETDSALIPLIQDYIIKYLGHVWGLMVMSVRVRHERTGYSLEASFLVPRVMQSVGLTQYSALTLIGYLPILTPSQERFFIHSKVQPELAKVSFEGIEEKINQYLDKSILNHFGVDVELNPYQAAIARALKIDFPNFEKIRLLDRNYRLFKTKRKSLDFQLKETMKDFTYDRHVWRKQSAVVLIR